MQKFKILSISILTIITSCTVENNDTNYTSPPEWSYNKTIYEVNIRQFTEKGNFEAFEKQLPRLKEMGVGILWLMPIHPIGEVNRKGTLGSYYSVMDYKGINPDFGNEEDFRRLVQKTHELGMYIILDWVANHTSWDHQWTKTNKEYYNLDSLGNFMLPEPDWSDVIDLNYENKDLWVDMIDALKYWVSEFDIDGYRCDVAAMVPNEFWTAATTELNNVKPVFMLAEAHEPELHEAGFHMTYSWQLKDRMNEFAQGIIKIEDLKHHFYEDEQEYPPNAFRMNFTTNHDENSWNGTAYERLGNLTEPFTVLISTAKGMPLVYSGQESGLNKRLEFFEKDQIEWKEHINSEIFTKIFNEMLNNKALWNGDRGGSMKFLDTKNEKVLAFYREKDEDKIIVMLNFDEQKIDVKITDPNVFGGFENLFENERIVIDNNTSFAIDPFGYIVLSN